MGLVLSLLQAIVGLDGDVLVIHAGEKPYVVAPGGQVDLATKALTPHAVLNMVAELLPLELRQALDEFGAVQYALPSVPEFRYEHFTVVAARDGDDVWVEIRRMRVADEDRVPPELFETPAETPRSDQANASAGAAGGFAQPGPLQLWTEEAPESASPRVPVPSPVSASAPPAPARSRTAPHHPGVVLPMSRSPVRPETPPPLARSRSGLDRLLRIAAARGASMLYVSSRARPSIRVDAEIQVLEGEAPLGPEEVESLLFELMPERDREALRSGVSTEWVYSDVPDIGHVRCVTFRDHRGAGAIFRIIPRRVMSADELGLSREIQALAVEPEGLVLVAGPRSSGKSTLVAALVDLINRSRRDYIISVGSEIKFVHESRHSLVSQREVRGSNGEMLAAVRAAIREDPDVLVIEELRTADLMTVALDAAGAGQLVLGELPAYTATAAVDRIIDLYPPEYRHHVQLALAETLRGIVVQVLLRKPAGGLVAAREVLLNTPAVASLIAEGKTSQLPAAMDGGRRYGMVPLNVALAASVQSGTVDAREAYRYAADRSGFLALLKRQGLDTSFVERLA